MSHDHNSRKSTERANYERLREAGIKRDDARRIAYDSSVETHRNADKQSSRTK